MKECRSYSSGNSVFFNFCFHRLLHYSWSKKAEKEKGVKIIQQGVSVNGSLKHVPVLNSFKVSLLQHTYLFCKSHGMCSAMRKNLKQNVKNKHFIFFAFMRAAPIFALIWWNTVSSPSACIEDLFRFSKSNLCINQSCSVLSLAEQTVTLTNSQTSACCTTQEPQTFEQQQPTVHAQVSFLSNSQTWTHMFLHLSLFNEQPNKHSPGKSALLYQFAG